MNNNIKANATRAGMPSNDIANIVYILIGITRSNGVTKILYP